MRELLEAVAGGSLSPAQAEAELRGYVVGDAGRFDAAREQRRGIPEAIFAEGKSAEQVVALAETALETTDRALLTRVSESQFEALETHLGETAPDVTIDRRTATVRVTSPEYERPSLDATVGIATGGTVDGPVADEAAMVLRDAGASVDRVDDIGVAALDRTLDQLDRLREADVLIVAAGREGALPTVVAGLVDTPVIGVPVASGYGHGGAGEAALAGMLQSCTVLSVVNIDAGFVAGAQATLFARAIDTARS
ncbi:nickel pincer cofactor biosynthesis protein LarB [Natrinema salsiterrestre]|uniref:Nickel pincer cofactor biosynthesis protein LarB n=1 Tax=Natrinema salsiterrestre TaxID=2950540 RepID=A0A9Q4Q1A2_9EURY|nr:nickel pincer cofactor biosynthesis protein LarB [Natrinema salsiterrestre]MDF9747765.1 nickel pincer cofactor biosynthesis protein LarB [Natrinema salsiterrestre]